MNTHVYPPNHKFTALEVMQDSCVIPVIVVDDVSAAVRAAQALCEGGIRMLEITLRTPKALDIIKAIDTQVHGAVVGAGTVISAKQADAAVKAGAKFMVSPGLTVEISRASRDLGVALLPGVATASEVMLALEEGFNELKFFPAQQAGGVPMLKALGGPFAQVKFCPTGGIKLSNAAEFLALSNVVCVGGSWLVPNESLEQKDWGHITQLAKEAKGLT